MTTEEKEELKANILHEVTEARRKARNITEDEKISCDMAYTDEYGEKHPDWAYVEGQDSGYIKALEIFDRIINKMN